MLDKITLTLILASAATNALGSTVMKHAYGGDSDMVSSGLVGAFLKIALNPWIVLGLGLFGVSFFHEKITLMRIGGMAFILAGITMLAIKS